MWIVFVSLELSSTFNWTTQWLSHIINILDRKSNNYMLNNWLLVLPVTHFLPSSIIIKKKNKKQKQIHLYILNNTSRKVTQFNQKSSFSPRGSDANQMFSMFSYETNSLTFHDMWISHL